jgi:hypothetical protein
VQKHAVEFRRRFEKRSPRPGSRWQLRNLAADSTIAQRIEVNGYSLSEAGPIGIIAYYEQFHLAGALKV